MELQQTIEPIADRLDEVLSTKQVPIQYREWGERLLDHLRRPVRIVVTGLPGSGKSSLINMMLARPVLGASAGIPVLDVVFGTEERVFFELEDGSRRSCLGLLADVSIPDRVIRVQQELPDPTLNGKCFRELGLGASPEIGKRILAAALKDADIVLWCTNSFAEAEQGLWSVVPDANKDHSFLVITRADRQMMRGVLSETIENLAPIVDQEFLGLYPVATLQGLSAVGSGNGADRQLWRSSGGEALSEEIARQISSGRAADIDQAKALLTQCGASPGRMADAGGAPARKATGSAPADDAAAMTPSRASAAKTDAKAGKILGDAVHILTRTGQELLREVSEEEAANTDAVLARCAETIGALSSHLHSAFSDDPAVTNAQEAAREGEEMLMLFQLERGEDAALDAVTLLLQLRKEILVRETA